MITPSTTIMELAVIVSNALEEAGVKAPLSGGGAVAIYADIDELTRDLDFVTSALADTLDPIMDALGFDAEERKASGVRYYEHPKTKWYVEFPPGPVGFGETFIEADDAVILETEYGDLRVISPTHSVMDRLTAGFHWNDQPSLGQARLVVESQPDHIEWDDLRKWAEKEGLQFVDVEAIIGEAP